MPERKCTPRYPDELNIREVRLFKERRRGAAKPELLLHLVDQASYFGHQVAFGARRPAPVKARLSQDRQMDAFHDSWPSNICSP